MSISDHRRDYQYDDLDEERIDRNPFVQFQNWLDAALKADLVDATAMSLATVGFDGRPSARIMLLKGFDENGLVFYSNYASRKGHELEANPLAVAVFYWASLERQVRVEGRVIKISREKSLNYFQSRPRENQLAALASRQGQILANRMELDQEYERLAERYGGTLVPLPDDWGGYQLSPDLFEFWQGRGGRLNDRIRFTLQPDGAWPLDRLAP